MADDLIWASRIVAAVGNAGADAVRAQALDELRVELVAAKADAAIIDLNGRGYDGVAVVAEAAGTGRPVVAIGQHEDVETRRRALAAGAREVHSYNRFFRDGPKLVARLLATLGADPTR
jgi:DNA-binding response OmpR family regulator